MMVREECIVITVTGESALQARFNAPVQIWVAADDSIYVADSLNNRIRRITPGGVVDTFTGSGQSLCGMPEDGGSPRNANISQPFGVAVDQTRGVVYSSDLCYRVRKVSMNTVSTVAGNGTTGSFIGDGGPAVDAQIYCSGLAVDGTGESVLYRYSQ